jgi:hypothetical protein
MVIAAEGSSGDHHNADMVAAMRPIRLDLERLRRDPRAYTQRIDHLLAAAADLIDAATLRLVGEEPLDDG